MVSHTAKPTLYGVMDHVLADLNEHYGTRHLTEIFFQFIVFVCTFNPIFMAFVKLIKLLNYLFIKSNRIIISITHTTHFPFTSI